MASQRNTDTIVKPTKFMDVEGIANELLKGRAMCVDLTSTPIEEAKRICDFLNGVTYALDGEVRKITKLIYLFTPQAK